MKTIIVWFRNDLRISDNPALAAAVQEADQVIPLFIFNDSLLNGKHASSNRNRFLLECLQNLDDTLQNVGGRLFIRRGEAAPVLTELVKQTDATAVYCAADYTPFALHRDKQVKAVLAEAGVALRLFPGRLIVDSFKDLHTKAGSPHKIFTPFYKNWLQLERRKLAPEINALAVPENLEPGMLPELSAITETDLLSPNVLKGGEAAACARFEQYMIDGVHAYHQTNNLIALNATSRLSPYLHFGCLSPLEAEIKLPDGEGPNAWRRQLAWRDFYNYVLFHYPDNAQQEFQTVYRDFPWDYNEAFLTAWQTGKTGYPIVDACMRQLLKEGWMHNRGRLIVGSFLTKDLGLDWRLGEQFFMQMLLDGDEANNNGNWQWIASVGVDPAPVFRRLYNPTSQQANYDPEGAYVRRYVPELINVPDKYLAEPWKMPEDVQAEVGCRIGAEYPAPIVDHKQARTAALAKYRAAK